MFFSNETRSNVKEDQPDLTFGQIGKELGRRWREDLSVKEKKKYNDLATVDKTRYQTEKEGYTPSQEFLDKVVAHQKKMNRKKKDPNAPKRPQNAFILFSSDTRGKIKEEHADWKIGDVGKELGRLWRGMTDKDKAPFLKLSSKDKVRYETEMKSYTEGLQASLQETEKTA